MTKFPALSRIRLGKHSAASRRGLIAAASAACLFSSSALAVDVTWLGTGSSLFNLAGNWNPAQVPSGADVAIFNNNLAGGTVAFNATASLAEFSFRNTSGSLTLDFGLNSVTASTRYLVANGAGQVNDVRFSNGTFTHTGTFLIGSANSHGNQVTVSGLTTTVLSTSTGTAVLGPATSNDNTLRITNGAYYQLASNISLGTATSTGNQLDIQDARFAILGGNRGVTINQGTLNVTNSYADMGLLTIGSVAVAGNAYVNFNSGTMLARRTTINNGRPFQVGDGGTIPATLALHSSGPTCSFANGLLLNSNGRLTGGTGTITGSVSGLAGAKVNPGILGVASTTADDQNFGTLTVTGEWNNTGIEMTLDVGDFPTRLQDDLTPPFDPPNNAVNVGGAFTHGGSVKIDLYDYVPPQDQNYTVRVLSFGSEVGSNASTPVSFVNGGTLASQWQGDGLYVTAAQVILPTNAWAIDGSGLWSDPMNWGSGVPDATDTILSLPAILTGPATITLDSARTVGKITISGSNNYTIAGTSTLTLDVDAISTARITATVGSGAHMIVPPINTLGQMCVNVGSTTLLTTSGTLSVVGNELRKIGPGTLAVGKVNVGTLTITDGTVKLTGSQNPAGVVETGGFSITTIAKLDVGSSAVVVNPASGDLAPEIRSALVTGHRLGLWNGFGINSSHAASTPGYGVGYARGSELGISTIFGSIGVDGNTVLIRETLNGDSNLDGKVNTLDFNQLAGGFGSVGPDWIDGDYDYDNDVDSLDFNALAGNYGKSLPPAAPGLGAVVPEPASLGAVTLLGLLARRRR